MTRQPPPIPARSDLSLVTTRNKVSIHFLWLYGQGMGWRAIGAKFGLSAGMALRVARDGYMPTELDERRRLRQLVALDYDAWKARNCDKLANWVRWAEAHLTVGA